MDNLSKQDRSERMSRVRAADTKPEMRVRRLVHAMGYRYRLHSNRLPGCPDMVFPKLRKIIFVHGCFWHRHKGCALARLPKSNLGFWVPKLNGNRERDLRSNKALRRAGWRIKVIWECQTANLQKLERSIERFLIS